jgi:molybdopterin-guanine dinucleotide biosynthesis protein A
MRDASTTAAAILAGGRARRFAGEDKSRLVVEGQPIIIRQLAILQRAAAHVFVVGSDRARYADVGIETYPDALPGTGVIGGIYTALLYTRLPRVLVLACDLPFVTAPLLEELVRRSHGHDGAWVRTSKGVEPLLACYAAAAGGRVLRQIQRGHLKAADLGGVLMMADVDADALKQLDPDGRALVNVNTPEDYAQVREAPSRRSS